MERRDLIFIRNFLLKYFVISFILTLIFFILTKIFWDYGSSFIYATFHISEEESGKIVLSWFAQLRFFMFFILLAPALALHWTIRNIR